MLVFGSPVRGRTCATCTACCTLVPVELDDGYKAAGETCRHVCSKGCGIYQNRPDPCRYWSCRWLFDATTADLRRPDKTGYVIDCMTDSILANGHPIEVLQVWVDPARPDAHEDPALRAYIDGLGMPAIVRLNNRSGFILVPPSCTGGEWITPPAELHPEGEMSSQIQAAREKLGWGREKL